ncbi:MAG: hypothetical protein CMF31_02020 [Kordiimonas sp.]|nr:hypothetical protein [Kordiimonas sp.]
MSIFRSQPSDPQPQSDSKRRKDAKTDETLLARSRRFINPQQWGRNERIVKAGFGRKVRKLAGRLPFAKDLVAGYYCAVDPKTPFKAKALLMGALAYFVIPTDLIPDFMAVVGYGDDLSVLMATIAMVREHMTPDHMERAEKFLRGDRRSLSE